MLTQQREGLLNAFRRALLSCHDALYRYARALTRDPWTADELVQETYRRALAARHTPPEPSIEHVRPWVFTILRNTWHNYQRDHRHEACEDLTDASRLASHDESPETWTSRQLLRSEIGRAIDSLPLQFREVVILREMEDLSYADIASIVGCPAGTVMSRLARARHMLRALLGEYSPSRRESRK